MINDDIKKKIYQCQEYLEKLSAYAVLASDEILKNEEKRLAMERLFLLMVDETVDINAALAYQLGGRIPESYKSTFFELVPLNILEGDFAEKISGSVKVRNQMTHDYEKVQHSELIDSMKKFVPMYKTYIRILISKFVSSSA